MFRDLDQPIAALRRDLAGVRAEIEETRALVALQEPGFSIPLPWSNWALPPRGLLEVLRTIQQFEAPVLEEFNDHMTTGYLAEWENVAD